jgi:hypothetical protein
LIVILDRLPWIRLQALETQPHAVALGFHIEDVHAHGLTRPQDVAGMSHPSPRELRDVNQTLESSQIDESPEGTEVGYSTFTDITRLEIVQYIIAMLHINLGRSLGEDKAIAVRIQLYDLERQPGSDEMA